MSSHGLLQNIPAGIVVSIQNERTCAAFIYSHGQGHVLDGSTSRAGLRRVGRVDFHHLSCSFFRFQDKLGEKRRPRRIHYRFRQFGIAYHAAHHQGLYSDEPEPFDQKGNVLSDEVLPAVGDTLMDARHHLAPLPLFWRFALCFGEFALRLGKCFFFFAEKAGILNLGAIGEVCKGLEADINTDLFIRLGP